MKHQRHSELRLLCFTSAGSPHRNNPQASPFHARSRVHSCMQAHAERGARDGEARRRRPSARGCPPAKHARMARHKGGRPTTTPLPRMRACACVRSTQPQGARLELERPSSPPRSRPASPDQAHRASSVGSHLEGGGTARPNLDTHAARRRTRRRRTRPRKHVARDWRPQGRARRCSLAEQAATP